jgi:molybdenum cofactor biosynthesis enzyme MoaA
MDACLRRWSSGSQFHVYVAQACNLRCSYCFNAQGAFGGPRRYMNLETA